MLQKAEINNIGDEGRQKAEINNIGDKGWIQLLVNTVYSSYIRILHRGPKSSLGRKEIRYISEYGKTIITPDPNEEQIIGKEN